VGLSWKYPIESVIRLLVPSRHRGKMLCQYRAFRERGSRVWCPCCGGRFRQFLPFGPHQRLNTQCPSCNCLDRHRLLWLFLKSKTDFFRKPLKVLHFAPESILEKAFRSMPSLDYTTADLHSSRAMVKMDVMDIQSEDNTYDVIICNHVLEHVIDDRKAMSELFRVLKPDGWAILQVPLDYNRTTTLEDPSINTPEAREQFYWQDDHLRLYGRDYPQRLIEAGFQAEALNFIQQLGDSAIKKYGLDPQELIYLCQKPVHQSLQKISSMV
jgi:SAM-dependent methyltransferase